MFFFCFFFFKQKTAYEMRISDWSSDVCSSDLFSLCAASFAFLFDPFHDIAHGFGTVRREVHARHNRQAKRRDASEQHPSGDCVVPVVHTPEAPGLLSEYADRGFEIAAPLEAHRPLCKPSLAPFPLGG